ncbi:hypothetical protein K3G39_04990 [Pontibacter sp. HSC-14F20]|uniref:hypothetical protein n=1 Tax=Pontibacter sp. HSC-14F20 TaxID=2864136 RepID=UPI001C731AC5|nr:hypothetical protein [Pontibacter sp. HSC-14F20]MBX0332587.1 hypothetical protein [Pontibacter sp. HSC-14F20]
MRKLSSGHSTFVHPLPRLEKLGNDEGDRLYSFFRGAAEPVEQVLLLIYLFHMAFSYDSFYAHDIQLTIHKVG